MKQALEEAKAELALITGQQPAETRAKKSIANFKLRKDQPIGAKVTLRGERMYEFLERLIKAALPRIRDFRGVSPRCFDGHGNYTLGVSDQSIFPEVELDKIKRNIGFDVTIVTTAQTDEEAKSLLSEMGMPFADRAKKHRPAQVRLNFMSTVTDPIADLLARMRNGARAQKIDMSVPVLEDQSRGRPHFEKRRLHRRLRSRYGRGASADQNHEQAGRSHLRDHRFETGQPAWFAALCRRGRNSARPWRNGNGDFVDARAACCRAAKRKNKKWEANCSPTCGKFYVANWK